MARGRVKRNLAGSGWGSQGSEDNLDLTEFVEGYNKDSFKYELYGVCNHSGGVLGGHYTATVKVKSGDWYLFNDTNVSKINFTGKNNTSGYCLFYRKKN